MMEMLLKKQLISKLSLKNVKETVWLNQIIFQFWKSKIGLSYYDNLNTVDLLK